MRISPSQSPLSQPFPISPPIFHHLYHHSYLVQKDPTDLLLRRFTYLFHVFSLVEFISENPTHHSSIIIKHLKYIILEALWVSRVCGQMGCRKLSHPSFPFFSMVLGLDPFILPTISSLFMSCLFWLEVPSRISLKWGFRK